MGTQFHQAPPQHHTPIGHSGQLEFITQRVDGDLTRLAPIADRATPRTEAAALVLGLPHRPVVDRGDGGERFHRISFAHTGSRRIVDESVTGPHPFEGCAFPVIGLHDTELHSSAHVITRDDGEPIPRHNFSSACRKDVSPGGGLRSVAIRRYPPERPGPGAPTRSDHGP